MRIYSKDHDYYDPILKLFSQDPNPVYKRKERYHNNLNMTDYSYQIKLRDNFLDNDKHSQCSIDVNKIIGFCGKLYPIIEMHESTFGYCVTNRGYFYDMEKVKHFYKNDNKKYNKSCEIYNKLKHHPKILELFQELNTPCFLIPFSYSYFLSKGNKFKEVTIDPILKDYSFQSAVDPYTAIQEINMYMSNFLVQDSNETVNITDDKVLKQAKGFGHKYAFKKEPTKKK